MAVSELVNPPTTEIGSSAQTIGVLPWSVYFDDSAEHVPELAWPNSIDTYARMRNDPQISGLRRARDTPLRRMRWSIDPNGTPARVHERLADNLGLPIKGKDDRPVGEPRGNFDFDYTLRHILMALDFGFMPFELVAEDDPDTGWTHLRKMGERMPRTVGEIKVSRDGGLESIRQNFGFQQKPIPADRLAMFVCDKEGANWTGRSRLRPMYMPWRMKDVLVRIDVMRHERAGVPTPVAKNPPDASSTQAKMMQQIAEAFKGGTASGASLPHGADLALLSGGKSTDVIESIRYWDQQMSRAWVAMLFDLGSTDHGSRALGETFEDVFSMSLLSDAEWICKVFNLHVIAKVIGWNVGVGAKRPKLVAEIAPGEMPTDELVNLVTAGIIVPDPVMEAYCRAKGKLPPKPEDEDEDVAPETGQDEEEAEPAEAPSRFVASLASRFKAKPRAVKAHLHLDGSEVAKSVQAAYRREPNRFELAAKTDFARMQDDWEDARDALLTEWKRDVSPALFESASEAVRQATAISDLQELEVDVLGVDLLEGSMRQVSEDAMRAALEEAAAQGADLAGVPDVEEMYELVTARAEGMATMIAEGLAATAARRAMQAWNGDSDYAAGIVLEHLQSLSDANLKDMLGGALTQAQHDGRNAVFKVAPDGTSFYSSELLDAATCDECRDVDETEYSSLQDATRAYPTGGYIRCKGMWRCRGALIAVYGDEGTSVEPEQRHDHEPRMLARAVDKLRASVERVLQRKPDPVQVTVNMPEQEPPVVHANIDVHPMQPPPRPKGTKCRDDGTMEIIYEGGE